MIKERSKQCKKKNCNNSVLDGKYCEYCKQKRRESRNKIIAVLSGPAILGLGVIIKKEVVKKGPEILAKVLKHKS